MITTKKLKADFMAEADKTIQASSLAVCRIKLGMLFCRLAQAEGWNFDREIEPVCRAAFESDRDKRGEDVGMGTLQFFLAYCEKRGAA